MKVLSTSKSRGTSCYRAPELLQDEAKFSKMVDIWSLGCVLHELITLKRAFASDYQVYIYCETVGHSFNIEFDFPTAFWQHQISECIRELLHRQPDERPRASTVCNLFSGYTAISTDMRIESLVDSSLSYSEWKRLADRDLSECECLVALAHAYQNKNRSIALGIYKGIVNKYVQEGRLGNSLNEWRNQPLSLNAMESEVNSVWNNLAQGLTDNLLDGEAIVLYKALLQHAPGSLSLSKSLSKLYLANEEYDMAIETYDSVIETEPSDLSAWHGLCEVYISKNDSENAVARCREGVAKYRDNPIPALILINVYAAKQDYKNAILTYMQARKAYGDNVAYAVRRPG